MRGDHLYIRRVGYTHHAIDTGDGWVIHYTGSPESPLTGRVERATLAEFAEGAEVRTREYPGGDAPDVVIARAESRLGEERYSLVTNNCEHFCSWCKTGRSQSRQVRKVAAAAAAIAIAALPVVARAAGRKLGRRFRDRS